jgi:hypothetical protein
VAFSRIDAGAESRPGCSSVYQREKPLRMPDGQAERSILLPRSGVAPCSGLVILLVITSRDLFPHRLIVDKLEVCVFCARQQIAPVTTRTR